MIEYQLKEQLYNWRDDVRPRVIGKFDEQGEWVAPRGEWLLPPKSDFSIAQIARALAGRIRRFHQSATLEARLKFLEAKEVALATAFKVPPRPAYYCAGCPHNRSTRTPEGSVALAGIGCHVMATAIFPESNKTMTQMGGEGATWIGQAPFSTLSHVFANLGDGTYFHSGSLAIRAAVAAGVNITYKILYNDAVAMTGGQPIDGPLSVADLVRQVAAEGVKRIAIVAEDPVRHSADHTLGDRVSVHARTELDTVQQELRQIAGVSILINDQTCAAEKRRRRKRGQMPVPARRAFINSQVCEGCGDCGRVSNCTAIVPLDTALGRKRAIDQDACNNDLSCIEGFCPSFVIVETQTTKARAVTPLPAAELELPVPVMPSLERPFNILITGVGGSGVITIGALLGMAAHLEGKDVSVLDMTGMSQKNGAVMSHVRISSQPDRLRAQRIAAGETDLLLAYDMITAGDSEVIVRTHTERTSAIVNTFEQPTGAFAQDRDWTFPHVELEALLRTAVADRYCAINSTLLAETRLGNAQAGNLLLLGFAWQRGHIPLGVDAIVRAIELNGVAVVENLQAFHFGRQAAVAPQDAQESAASRASTLPESLDDRLAWLSDRLRDYQNAAYAARFRGLVDAVKRRDGEFDHGFALTRAVAENYYKLLAYKDEYEVARLFAGAEFRRSLATTFDGPVRFRFSMAPPLLARRDGAGHPRKMEFGSWLMPVLRALRHLKVLRGTRFDPFGRSAERKLERHLIEAYRVSIETALSRLDNTNYAHLVTLAGIGDGIRGYGHVKLASLREVLPRWRDAEQALGFHTVDFEIPDDAIDVGAFAANAARVN